MRDAAGKARDFHAVNGVSFRIDHGETVGLVGESGCGKTSVGRALLRLVEPAAGRIRFEGADVQGLRGRELKTFRRRAQMIFQDRMGSLNPRLPVGAAIREVLHVHHLAGAGGAPARVQTLMNDVGLDAAYAGRYPHEFSGGQRQRLGIARALAVEPVFLVADEPVSALDVSVQAQILNLLKRLQEERRLACLFIAHDLAVVRFICRRTLVMYRGGLVESALSGDLFARPTHPYTRLLLQSVPDVDRGLAARFMPIGGAAEAPAAQEAASGCAFAARCPHAADVCRREIPSRRAIAEGHDVACHFAGEI